MCIEKWFVVLMKKWPGKKKKRPGKSYLFNKYKCNTLHLCANEG